MEHSLDSRVRNACIVTVFVSGIAGLVGAALVARSPEPCVCQASEAAAVFVLPDVEVVATRLPAPRAP